ncbi:MAG TPA: hypothetical protein DDZ74_17095, partial [Pseudomonas sp.]|nr:hypothetical protein [Pseudomonas sp.]
MTVHENPEGLTDVGVADLLRLLTLERLGSQTFIGHSTLLGAPRVYGGQLLAQSLMAMGATVPGEHHLHSLHGYFIQPGDVRRPLALQVEVLREGRNFSTRAVKVQQGKRLVFSGAASFHRAEGDY